VRIGNVGYIGHRKGSTIKKKTPWPVSANELERPSLFDEVSANSLRIEGATWSARRIPTVTFSAF
jgi:hypothetical protein